MHSPGRLSLENRLRLLTQQVLTTALDLVFPPVCVGCERVGSFLCARCSTTLKSMPPRDVPGLDGVRVRTCFEGVIREALHALKYENQKRQAEPLGALLDQALIDVDWPVEVVCPVPLHAKRLRERGYNQAGLLAHQLSVRRGWDYVPSAVERCRETASQIDLGAQERRANVAGAFVAQPDVVSGKAVLVVDDVLTTGSTLAACADALRAAGATRVYGVTVAGAVMSDPLSDQ